MTPQIDYVDGCHAHVFECAVKRCQGKNGWDVCWLLDKSDAKSTSGLCQHAKNFWGNEAVKSAGMKDLEAAHVVLAEMMLHDGSITAKFEHIRKGKVAFHTVSIHQLNPGKIHTLII